MGNKYCVTLLLGCGDAFGTELSNEATKCVYKCVTTASSKNRAEVESGSATQRQTIILIGLYRPACERCAIQFLPALGTRNTSDCWTTRAAAMPKLDEVPVEVLAHVALFANRRSDKFSYEPLDLSELLALRCASRSCKDAVRRAAKHHRALRSFSFQRSSALKIAAIGRVFGSGCRSLTFGTVQSDEAYEARKSLQNFVTSTNGQLRSLSYSYSGASSQYFSMPELRELCRACPLLRSLFVHGPPTGIITAANLDEFASAVGRACPRLRCVWLPSPRSPAEDYQRHFPRIECLNFMRAGSASAFRWDGVEAMLRACVHATEVDLTSETVSPRLVDLILAAPAAGRLKRLDLCEAEVSPELILRLAGGLETLSDLQFPLEFDGGCAFYSSLVQARPSIAKLGLGLSNELDDDALRIICDGLRLEHLELTCVQNLTNRAINIILESPCAETLRSIEICHAHQFSSEDVLRLVRGCPELAELSWEIIEDVQLLVQNAEAAAIWDVQHVDGPNVDAINALLESRGGKATRVPVLQEDGSWRKWPS